MTPTARALRWLRDNGYRAEVVEKRLPHCFVTRDAFGIIDIIGLRPGELAAFQVTSGANHASRKVKAIGNDGTRAWLEAGGRFYLLSFSKTGPHGKRKLWTARLERLAIEDVLACVRGQGSSTEGDPPHP
jgi:hypothetical protein